MTEANLADWIGRQETLQDEATATPARLMAATLDRSDMATERGDLIPPMWLWFYFLPSAPMSQVGPDGHPKRGGFLPPVELPRRMWAGSRCTFHAPVRIGDTLERTSTILNVVEKSGKAGPMVFVTVRHENRANGALAMVEEQDIVYLNIPERFAPPPPVTVPHADWSENVDTNPVLLFRFSALTFNGHRIHYDRSYTMDVEHYPGLVVHGPLQAALLFDAGTRHNPGKSPASFHFRGQRPLFDFDAITLNGKVEDDGSLNLFTATAEGGISMQAGMTWA